MNARVGEQLQPRREMPRLIRWRVRRLVAPDGSRHRVKVPVYGPPESAAHIRLPVFNNLTSRTTSQG